LLEDTGLESEVEGLNPRLDEVNGLRCNVLFELATENRRGEESSPLFGFEVIPVSGEHLINVTLNIRSVNFLKSTQVPEFP